MPKIEGQSIINVRQMSKKEISSEFWEKGTIVIELNNGVILYASCDEEGNAPGTMFGFDKQNNKSFSLM